jgi:Zn-dependent peptidase ImmA (M78 family)
MKPESKTDAARVPQLSSNDIELKAEEVIKFFDPAILASAKPTPVREFALETKRRFGVDFRDDIDLGSGGAGRKCLGQFRIKPRGIFIDVSLNGSDRLPFVLAHEYGHLVLHRHIDPQKSGYSTSSIEDTEYDFVTNRKRFLTPRDWIEWQANRFAAALLMPRATFSDSLIDFHKSQGIQRNIGVVFVDATASSRHEFGLIVGHLTEVYGVNRTNIECRLRDLELLQDHRSPSTHHISELLKEE